MRQIRRNDARDQECHSKETEAVQDEQRSQRLRPLSTPECRPDVACRDDPPRDHAEGDAPEECELLQHARLLSLWFRHPVLAASGGTNRYRLRPSVVLFGTDVKSKRTR